MLNASRARGALRLGLQAIMSRENGQREFQHQLGRTARPLALAFDHLKTFEKATDIHKQASKLRPHRPECEVGPLPRGEDGF